VAAYAVAHGLAGEKLAGFGFALPLCSVVQVAIETDEIVDDVAIRFESGKRSLIQAKRRLQLGPAFTKACAQWGDAARDHLDPATTRIVIVGASASENVRVLASVLERSKADVVGQWTTEESKMLARLRADVGLVTDAQFGAILKAGVILQLDVEEETSAGSVAARSTLRHVLDSDDDGVAAWRTLLHVAGRVARLRGGFGIDGWARELADNGVSFKCADSTVAHAVRSGQAFSEYRKRLIRKGTLVDLRALGAECAPIPLDELDAEVSCFPSGEDRDSEDLLWSLIRRGRMILTGLPGGGKTTAIHSMSARMLEVPGLPTPLVVSLRAVARKTEGSFESRVLEVAVEGLPDRFRGVMRDRLAEGLLDGRTAVVLDGLDETHDQRGRVVAEVSEFADAISDNVPILLATRTVGYAQAASLGWPSLSLGAPKAPDRSVRAVLEACARSRSMSNDLWVERRASWVGVAMGRDTALRETPLIPVLLALLAADRDENLLPTTKARVLQATVEATVKRREQNRDQSSIPGLHEAEAPSSLLEAFEVEASLIADSGTGVPLTDIVAAVASKFEQNWGLPSGRARVAAEAAARFWDELGVFVIATYDDRVQPRIEVLLDIGDALGSVRLDNSAIVDWVDKRIASHHLESVKLAASLSRTVADRFSDLCSRDPRHEIVSAALEAMTQDGLFSESARQAIAEVAIRDASIPDRQGWETFAAILGAGFASTIENLLPSMSGYPPEHQLVARAAAIACGAADGAISKDEAVQLLDLRGLRSLSPRDGFAEPDGLAALLGRDQAYVDAVVAAARVLLESGEDGAAVVAAAIHGNRSRKINRHLTSALEDGGFEALIPPDEPLDKETIDRTTRWMRKLEHIDPLEFIDLLSHGGPRATLSASEVARLDTLASLYSTLNLAYPSGWPSSSRSEEWMDFIDALLTIAGVDRDALEGEVAVMRARLAIDQDDRSPFWALGIESTNLELSDWSRVDDVGVHVRRIAQGLYLSRDSASVAAEVLAHTPGSAAVDVLTSAVERLSDYRDHQWASAFALVFQLGRRVPEEWANSEFPALRLVDVQLGAAQTPDGRVDPRLRRALHDVDREVGTAAVRVIADSGCADTVSVLRNFVDGEPSDWVCRRCSIEVAGSRDSCPQCHIVSRDPRTSASEKLGALASSKQE
jgi:hypothetical protein